MNILLCFLWLFSATLSAQQVKIVKGHVCVLSEDSIERSLPYASVVVLEGKDSAFVKGMASDANGSFKLEFIHKSEWNTCCGYLISVCQLSFGS